MRTNFNLLKKRKTPVYVKYITHPGSKNATRLKKEHYLLFYLSRMDKSIVGYTKIKNISYKMPEEIKADQLNKIQMEKKEFDAYSSDRQSKPLLFLELDRIVTLENPVKMEKPMTMAGQYVSIKGIKQLLGDDILG